MIHLDLTKLLQGFSSFRQATKLEEKLIDENYPLEEYLKSEEAIQCYKDMHKNAKKYFNKEKIKQLIKYVIEEPQNDEYLRGHKYPYFASEMLKAECTRIQDLFVLTDDEYNEKYQKEEENQNQKIIVDDLADAPIEIVPSKIEEKANENIKNSKSEEKKIEEKVKNEEKNQNAEEKKDEIQEENVNKKIDKNPDISKDEKKEKKEEKDEKKEKEDKEEKESKEEKEEKKKDSEKKLDNKNSQKIDEKICEKEVNKNMNNNIKEKEEGNNKEIKEKEKENNIKNEKKDKNQEQICEINDKKENEVQTNLANLNAKKENSKEVNKNNRIEEVKETIGENTIIEEDKGKENKEKENKEKEDNNDVNIIKEVENKSKSIEKIKEKEEDKTEKEKKKEGEIIEEVKQNTITNKEEGKKNNIEDIEQKEKEKKEEDNQNLIKKEISNEEIKEKYNKEIIIPHNELLDLLLSYIEIDKTELNDVLAGYFTNILITLIDKYPTKLILYFYILRKDVLEQIINHSYQRSLSKLSFKILKIEDILNNILLDVKNNPRAYNIESLAKKVEESKNYRNELVGQIIISLTLEGFKNQKGNIINNEDIEPLFDLSNDLIQEKSILIYIVSNFKIYKHIFEILEKEMTNKSENEQKNYISFISLLTNIFSMMNKFKKEFEFRKNPENNLKNEIKDEKKENINFFEEFKKTFIKILSSNYADDSTISSINTISNKNNKIGLGLRNFYIFLLVIEVFNYMEKDKALDFDEIIISTKFFQKSIDFFFKFQLNNIYHYKFLTLFNLYLENESEHSLLTDYLFKEMKFHETLVDYIHKEEELKQKQKKDDKIEDKKEEIKNLQNRENTIINEEEKNEPKKNNIEKIDNKDDQKNNKEKSNIKEKNTIENEHNKEEKDKKEENKSEINKEINIKENEEKKNEINKESDNIKDNKIKDNTKENEENKMEKSDKKEEVKDNGENKIEENKSSDYKFINKKKSLLYPIIINIIYKIQTISGLKTLDETDKKSLNIINLGEFEFVKDENSRKTVLEIKTSDKLNEILKASDKWISTFEKIVLPEIKKYESKLCPDNTINKEKPKPPVSNINNLLGLLNLISNNLNKKNQNESEKKKEENNLNQSPSTEKGESSKNKEENNLNQPSSPEIEEKNSKYNDTNFWQVNSEFLVDEKEIQSIINDL